MKQLYYNLINAEPSRLINGVAAILVIVVNLLAYLLPQFSGAVAGVISAAIIAIAAELVRSIVYAPATVNKMQQENQIN